MSATQQPFDGATSGEHPEARQKLVLRAIDRARALLNNPSTATNINAARLHFGYYANMSDKTIELWLKETDEDNRAGDSSSSEDEDKGTRAPHAASAGKKKAGRDTREHDSPAHQENKKAAEKAAEMAEAAVAGKHGIDIDRTALDTEKPNASDFFEVTKEHRKILDLPASVTHIPFLIPSKGQGTDVTGDSIVAVRLNERYEDATAIANGERTNTRKLMLRAGKCVVITCSGKNPILFMTDFATDQITDGIKRACDACADRVTFVEHRNRPQIALMDTETPDGRRDFRITGTIEEMDKLMAELCTDDWKKQQRPHHVSGLGVLHAYLTPEELKKVQAKKVAVELKKNIVSSGSKSRQLTIRKTDASPDAMFELTHKLQTGMIIPTISKSATATFCTHGTIRVTLDVEVTAEVLKALRQQLPAFRMFTDVPINVWASAPGDGTIGAINVPRPPKPQPVRKPLSNDHRLVRVAADYEPHPDAFTKIAEFFKGSVHNIREPRFTDRPMDALISIPKDTDIKTYIAEGFAIDTRGSWTMEPVGVAFGAGSV
jgi:hypothetical protein